MGLPSNFSGKASRGLTGGVGRAGGLAGAGGRLAASRGWLIRTPCKAVTSTSVSVVSR